MQQIRKYVGMSQDLGESCLSQIKKKYHILPENEKKFSDRLNNTYKFLSVYFLPLTFVCLFVAFVFDIIPAPYCCAAVENFFCHRDHSPIMNTSLVIWTFGASLLVYFMGRMENRCFGIRFYEALLAREGRAGLLRKVLVFLGEIFLLEICATCPLRITFFAVCMLQPVNIIYIFMIIMQETSQDIVVKTITQQTEAVLEQLAEERKTLDIQPQERLKKIEEKFNKERTNWLMMKALWGVNYNHHEDMEVLSTCLSAERWEQVKDYADVQLLVSWKYACFMLDGGHDNSVAWTEPPVALTKLFQDIVSNPQYPDHVKEGILAALLIYDQNLYIYDLFFELLENIKDISRRGKVIDWNFYLLEHLVSNNILPERKRLCDELYGLGEDYGCAPSHILNVEDQELLDAFLSYLGYVFTVQDEDLPETLSEEEVVGRV